MARTVGIGKQNYEKVVGNNIFYVDKTLFIKEWWENEDEVILPIPEGRFARRFLIFIAGIGSFLMKRGF